jgi:hypothetical protein
MTKAKNDATAWYTHSYLAGVEPDFTGGWPKSLGSKPTADMLETAHYFSPQGPGKQAFALALTLRPEGVTRGQISQLFQGHQQSNHRQAQIDAGYFDRLPHSVPGVDKSKCYKLELTELGAAFIERRKVDKAAKQAAVQAKLEGKVKQVEKPAKPAKAEPVKPLEVKAAPKAKRPSKAKAKPQPVAAEVPATVPADAVSYGGGIDALTA